MAKWRDFKRLTAWTGIFISGVLMFIYWKELIDPNQMWGAAKKMIVTMYWFSVAFFFRLGARQIISVYTYSLVKGGFLVFLGYHLRKNGLPYSQPAYIIGFWTFFHTLTSAMMKKPYADYIYYKFSRNLYTIIPGLGDEFLQKTYNIIMDKIVLDSTSNWTYYDWIYFRHKAAKRKSSDGTYLCTTTREYPHEGWVVFYFEYILPDEVYETNLKQVLIMQPYTSLLSMEGTQRVGIAVQDYLNKYNKKDNLHKALTHIKEEIKAETLKIRLK